MYKIYLIQIQSQDGPVKIGLTASNPKSRILTLQTALPWDIKILHIIEGPRALEAALHHRYAHLHIRGEWYSFAKEMLDEIDSNQVLAEYYEAKPAAIKRRSPFVPIRVYGDMTVVGELKHLVRT
jgi:hypothetical protein